MAYIVMDLMEMQEYICEYADELEHDAKIELIRLFRDANVRVREKQTGVQILMSDIPVSAIATIYNYIYKANNQRI